jgi:hypothetical protein
MRIREENRNMVLLAAVALFTAAIAGMVALVDPTPPPPDSKPLPAAADGGPVRVIGAPFRPTVYPREHR